MFSSLSRGLENLLFRVESTSSVLVAGWSNISLLKGLFYLSRVQVCLSKGCLRFKSFVDGRTFTVFFIV